MVGDLLRHFEFAAVLQIGGDAGRAESMIANPRFDAGRFGAPADNGVTARNGIFSTLRPFVGDLTKRKRARIRLQVVSAQIWVLTAFSFPGVRLCLTA